MDLFQLKAFCTVVNSKSISEAARILHLTQPGLSLKIKGLEDYFGVSLLSRTNKGVEPTLAGKIIYEFAQMVLDMARNVEQEIENLKKDIQKHLVIAASNTLAEYALPCSLVLFKERNPDVTVEMRINNTAGVLKDLYTRTVGIGLLEGPLPGMKRSEMDMFVIHKLARDELVVVSPPGWFKKKQSPGVISLKQIGDNPLIIREQGSGITEMLEKTLKPRKSGLNYLNVVLEVSSIDAIKSAVAAGKGISFLPRMAVKAEVARGLMEAFCLDGLEMQYPYYLLYNPGKTTGQTAKKFLDFIISPEERGFC